MKRLKTGKRKGTYAELSGPRKQLKQLKAYYLQGGKWHRVKEAV